MTKPISQDEVRVLSQYVYSLSGVALDASKAYLLETRLRPVIQKHGATSYLDLHAKATADRSGEIEKEIIDAITTNETLFFRDNSPFEVFKHKILPDLIDARSKAFSGRPVPLRIWSAACSTGQEVYSIAMALRETLGNLDRYQISILGTDISSDAVAKASYGAYSKFEIERGLPVATLRKYFTAVGDSWRIKDELRSLATFKKFNLMRPFVGLGKFDVVFCRNVAIYFTPADKKIVFEKIATVLEPDGALIIGSTESLSGVTPVFEPKRYMRAVFYQRTSQVLAPGALADGPRTPPVSVTSPKAHFPALPRPTATPSSRRPVPVVSLSSPVSRPLSASVIRSDAPETAPLPRSLPEAEPVAPVQALSSLEPEDELPQVVRPPLRSARRAGGSAVQAGDKSALKRRLMEKKKAARAKN